MSTSSQDQRKADTLMQQNKKSLSGVRLVLNKQVATWKAMFVALFVAGFCAAIAWVASISVNVPQDTQEVEQLSYQGYGDRRYNRQLFPIPPDRSGGGERRQYDGNQVALEDGSLVVSPDDQDREDGVEERLTDVIEVGFNQSEAALPQPLPNIRGSNYGWPYGTSVIGSGCPQSPCFKAGTMATSNAAVENVSNVAVKLSTSHRFDLINKDNGQILSFYKDTGPLGSKTLKVINFTYQLPTQLGSYRTQLCADDENMVTESNESDNCHSLYTDFTIVK